MGSPGSEVRTAARARVSCPASVGGFSVATSWCPALPLLVVFQ